MADAGTIMPGTFVPMVVIRVLRNPPPVLAGRGGSGAGNGAPEIAGRAGIGSGGAVSREILKQRDQQRHDHAAASFIGKAHHHVALAGIIDHAANLYRGSGGRGEQRFSHVIYLHRAIRRLMAQARRDRKGGTHGC